VGQFSVLLRMATTAIKTSKGDEKFPAQWCIARPPSMCTTSITSMAELIVEFSVFMIDRLNFCCILWKRPSLNTLSCIKEILVVQDFCFLAI
jgi:hypothetical protein